MEKVLNRGLNFCVLPLKLDLTQLLVDFKRFERTMIWHEFWYGREQSDNINRRLFKSKKTNHPKNYNIPKHLKMFLCAMKSELIDPKNRNQVECNLPSDELEALKILIQLQRDRIITIKPCDKGAGVIILDFEEYVNVCNEHLNSLQENPNDEMKPFYHKIDSSQLDEAKIKIKHVLEEALDNKVITNTEYEAMNPENKNPGKFYCTFKVHKDHEEGRAPPPRPIISGCGSIIENIGVFVEHFVKNEATKHRSYLQDTPDFLRQIEVLNKRGILPINAILVTADVCGLFTNIPHQECIQTTQCALNERTDPNMSTEFIIRLLELILKYNIFEYNGDLYQQDIGTAMGSRPAPSISNIFMANKIDDQFIKMSIKYAKYGEKSLIFLKIFLDDLFFCILWINKAAP